MPITRNNFKVFALLGIFIIGAILISGCTDETTSIDVDDTHLEDLPDEGEPTEDVTEHHWGYEGEGGPEHWAELGNPDCSGNEQSPIDIPAGTLLHNTDISFNYHPSALNIVNNGHSIEVEYDEGSSIEVENNTYQLLQLHFHSLSENTIMGEYSDMEMHLVHQSNVGEYAVVGVMMEAGSKNNAYAPIWENMPAEVGDIETIRGVNVIAVTMLPENRTYYRFDGLFTTPPCTEGVKWFLMSNPVELSPEQIDAFREIYSHNYRPVQPFNDREFY
ncbi:MAG: carbonic anhydrase family protein [ANME-2 cluster archaeon]|nr:carbonic anhydrase family protein [ANME-2 cluster archaeon]